MAADNNGAELSASLTEILRDCAMNGDLAGVKAALAAGAHPNDRELTDSNDDTLLIQVVRYGEGDSLPICEALLDGGADMNHEGDYDSTALHRAGYAGKADIALLLLKRGARLDTLDKNGHTPCEAMLDDGKEDTALALIDAGLADHAGAASILAWYAAWGHPSVLSALAKRGVDVLSERFGFSRFSMGTPARRAAEAVAHELSYGEDGSAEDSLECLRILVETGADLRQRESDGKRPLDELAEDTEKVLGWLRSQGLNA